MRVSHETIYRSLFVQARGALRKELTACLRTGRTQRRSHKRSEHSGTGRLRDMVLISDRPAGAADRAVPGHWEGDLMVGKGGRSAIGTLVERSSRYVVLLHLPRGRTAEHVRRALTHQLSKLPTELRRTLTWDQGKEMAEHAQFTVDTKIAVYFCDPHSPWSCALGFSWTLDCERVLAGGVWGETSESAAAEEARRPETPPGAAVGDCQPGASARRCASTQRISSPCPGAGDHGGAGRAVSFW